MGRILPILFLLISITLNAQEPDDIKKIRPRNNISLNVLGDVTLLSGNYERILPLTPNILMAAKIGIGYNLDIEAVWADYSRKDNYFAVPMHLSTNFGKERLFLELGYGYTYLRNTKESTFAHYPLIGFRMLPTEKERCSFRMFFYLPLNFLPENYFFIPLGFNFGYAF